MLVLDFGLGQHSFCVSDPTLQVVTEILHDRRDFIHDGHHETLSVSRYGSRLWIHMLHDDIGFSIVDIEMSSCIRQGDVWVLLPVERTMRIGCLTLSPVVEEKIVQESTSCSRSVVETKSLTCCVGEKRHTHDVIIDRGSMVVVILQFHEFDMVNDVRNECMKFRQLWSCYQLGYHTNANHEQVHVYRNKQHQQGNGNDYE